MIHSFTSVMFTVMLWTWLISSTPVQVLNFATLCDRSNAVEIQVSLPWQFKSPQSVPRATPNNFLISCLSQVVPENAPQTLLPPSWGNYYPSQLSFLTDQSIIIGNMVHTGLIKSHDFILALISKRIEHDYSILKMCFIG